MVRCMRLSRGYFNHHNYKRQTVRIPSFENKEVVAFESKFFVEDKLVDSESTSILYLKEGEKSSYIDYENASGSFCGKLQYFTNEKLEPFSTAGKYSLNVESTFHTSKQEDSSAITVVSHNGKNLISPDGKIISIPQIANDTFFYPKEFKITEGKEINRHDRIRNKSR